MASPAKKRKKNDHHSSTSTVGSIEHFFSKQNHGSSSKSVIPTGLATANANEQVSISQKSPVQTDTNACLTDEEIARKLQEEWNNGGLSPPGDSKSSMRNLTLNAEIDARHDNDARFHHPDFVSAPKNSGENDGAMVASIPEQDGGKETISNAKPNANANAPLNPLSLQSTASGEDKVTLTIPFDENPLIFQPQKYISDLKRHWAADGGEASYAVLTRCFVLVNSTTSRIKIVDTLTNCLRLLVEADPESLLPAVSDDSPTALVQRSGYFAGMACNQLYRASICFYGARAWWVGHIEGAEEDLWSRQPESQSTME